jgi:hypothetical protein
MTRRRPPDLPDHASEEALTFTDVTILAFLAVSAVALAALVLLGTVSAEHRIVSLLGQG